MNYVAIIEYLTKSRAIRDGEFDLALKEILEKSTEGLGIDRANAWAIDKDFNKLTLVGAYIHSKNSFTKNTVLLAKDYPNYFSHLKFAEKIVSDDALTSAINSELIDSYIKPNKITSMMDIPVRTEGDMIGVVCFEHTGEKRLWTLAEQSFAISISQLISLAFESYKKNQITKQLEFSLKEKEVLLSEINHRVKNNISIIASLLNLQKHKSKDEFHAALFDACRERILSMSFVHDQLYQSDNYTEIDFGKYLDTLLVHLSSSFSNDQNIKIIKNIERIPLDIKRAIPCGIVTNEIVTNSYKYAFRDRRDGIINVDFGREGMMYYLRFKDDGPGINLSTMRAHSTGINIIRDLVDQLNGSVEIKDNKGAQITIKFPI